MERFQFLEQWKERTVNIRDKKILITQIFLVHNSKVLCRGDADRAGWHNSLKQWTEIMYWKYFHQNIFSANFQFIKLVCRYPPDQLKVCVNFQFIELNWCGIGAQKQALFYFTALCSIPLKSNTAHEQTRMQSMPQCQQKLESINILLVILFEWAVFLLTFCMTSCL